MPEWPVTYYRNGWSLTAGIRTKLSAPMDSLISIYLTARFLNMPYQHAVAPELMFILESIWLANYRRNNICPNEADSKDSHQISDRTIFSLIEMYNHSEMVDSSKVRILSP